MQGRRLLTAWAALLLLAQVLFAQVLFAQVLLGQVASAVAQTYPSRPIRQIVLMPPAAPPTRSRAWRATSLRRSWASLSSSTAGPAPTASWGRRWPPAPRP